MSSRNSPIYIENMRLSNKTRLFKLSMPGAFSFKDSAIRIIWIPVTIMATYAGIVVWLNTYFTRHALPVSVIPFISVVLGLLLVFRSNTAYDRYYEGRKLWTDIKNQSRILTRNLCIGVKNVGPNDEKLKREAIRYILAYVVAVKHYLRGEKGTNYLDFQGLLPATFLFKFKHISTLRLSNYSSTGNSPLGRSSSAVDGATLGNNNLSGRSSGSASTRNSPVGGNTNADGDEDSRLFYFPEEPEELTQTPTTPLVNENQAVSGGENVNIPMHIMCEIAKYVETARDSNRMAPQMYGNIIACMNSLASSLAGCERIVATPIPLNYSIHLKQSVYVYLLILPWCILELNPIMVTLVEFITAFLLIGIEGIGAEIENPFGYDRNDLPLDTFCQTLKHELWMIERFSSPVDGEIPEDDDL
ncbi:hypothetical protein H4219_003430 [Mycoemilia scoparia]|uniref:Bestrophin homolog n=1 Tax=Mycoemilia scoparia TaxID=417184 RepID=A0A9W8DSM6_9FUNG|nr:hypothetical protein H4219_003430 [Mycoemilia scoparia]